MKTSWRNVRFVYENEDGEKFFIEGRLWPPTPRTRSEPAYAGEWDMTAVYAGTRPKPRFKLDGERLAALGYEWDALAQEVEDIAWSYWRDTED